MSKGYYLFPLNPIRKKQELVSTEAYFKVNFLRFLKFSIIQSSVTWDVTAGMQHFF